MIERNQTVVTMHDVSPLALRQLIDYAYSGEITITEDNVQVMHLDFSASSIGFRYPTIVIRSIWIEMEDKFILLIVHAFAVVLFPCRCYCPLPVYCRYNRCVRHAANSCFASSTHQTVWEYEASQVRNSLLLDDNLFIIMDFGVATSRIECIHNLGERNKLG